MPIRLSLVTTATSVGGAWRNVVDLADGLRDRGHDVVVGLSSEATAPRAEAHRRGLTVCSLTESLERRNQIWHMHLHNTYDPKALTLIAARRTRGPVVTTEHLPHFNGSDRALLDERDVRTTMTEPMKTLAKRASIATCDAVIIPSERVTEFFKQRYQLGDSRKLHFVPYGITPTADPVPVPDEPIGTIIASGSFIVQKGFDLLLEATRRSRASWHLVILGDGAHRVRLAEEIDSTLPGRVSLPGWRDDPAPWVKQARAICLPSRWETLPFAAIEAQMAGRPVVAFGVDGIPEIVEDGVTGLVVSPGDVDGLATALDALGISRGRRGWGSPGENAPSRTSALAT